VPTSRILVVVPAFNEEASVATVVAAIRAEGYDVAVVDDGSTDDTAAVAADAGAVVLRLPVNLGVGGALRCGFRWAALNGYQVAVQCDADGQHQPQQIRRLLDALEANDAALCVGSRFADGRSSRRGVRHRAMRILTATASHYTKVALTDATSGFRAIREPLLSEFAASYPVEYLGDTVEALIAAGRGGHRVVEVPVSMSSRQAGGSTASSVGATWYTIRVLAAVLLRAGRTASARPSGPIGRPRPEHAE
jgi:glycosyltransferase involved in cell wall biosynthesis